MDESLFDLGKSLIRPDLPSGESARYEPEFEKLTEEIAKLESLSSESIDWSEVVSLAQIILDQKSKDLLAVSYLGRGLMEQEGYKGLSCVLTIMRDMIEIHWEALFPPKKRLRARSSAVVWLAEKAAEYMTVKPPTDVDAEYVLVCDKIAREIDGLLFEQMGDSSPALTALTRPLKEFKRAAEYAKKQEKSLNEMPTVQQKVSATAVAQSEPPPKTPSLRARSKSSALSSSSSTTIENVTSEPEARKALRSAQDFSRKVTAYWLKSTLSDPRIYRINRTAAWLNIQKAPNAVENVTLVPAPPADKIKAMETLFAQSQPKSLIPELEQILSKFPYWFSGHRMVAVSLATLGSDYADAKNAVIDEVAHFLHRVPGVAKMKFADGTAFVDDQTQMWLTTEVQVSSHSSPSADVADNSEERALSPWLSGFNEAKKAGAGGKIEKGIQILENGIVSAASVRDKIYWRLMLAEYLIQIGQISVAVIQLELMVKSGAKYHLNEWEPKLFVAIQKHLYENYSKLLDDGKKDKDLKLQDKLDLAFTNLCELDPTSAISK